MHLFGFYMYYERDVIIAPNCDLAPKTALANTWLTSMIGENRQLVTNEPV